MKELEVKKKLKEKITHDNNSTVTEFISESYIIKKDRIKRKELFDDFNSTGIQNMSNKAFFIQMRYNGVLEIKSYGTLYCCGLKLKLEEPNKNKEPIS